MFTTQYTQNDGGRAVAMAMLMNESIQTHDIILNTHNDLFN